MKRLLHSPEDREEIYRRFIAYIEEWRRRLPLREWGIDIHLETEGDTTGPSTQCRPKYHEADIIMRLPEDREACWTDAELEDTAIHELMHILVSTWFAVWERTHRKPLSSQMHNMLLVTEEQLCTRLALGFMRTRYPRRHHSSSGGQGQVSPRRAQAPQ